MKIQVNGEDRDVPEGMTIGGLARQLDVRSDRVAVEVNLQILDREEFERRQLHEGDHVEIIGFIGGGSEEFRD